jgi:GNAT superfamily N-acetyltransferase
MEYVRLTKDNLESEHICCAISDNKDPQVRSKKAWLSDRLDEGLVFLKAKERGKCFIEYIPAEYAWVPIEADGYLFIDCFWVSGSFKGHGYANDLLNQCIAEGKTQGKQGICVISSTKKRAFLSDPDYLIHKGFRPADTAEPFFTLLYLPLKEDANAPRFKDCAKAPHIDGKGFVILSTAGCPFTAKYVPLIEQVAKEHGIPCKSVLLDTREKAQNAPVAWTTYALFHDGAYVTNEIQSEKKFLALAEEH